MGWGGLKLIRDLPALRVIATQLIRSSVLLHTKPSGDIIDSDDVLMLLNRYWSSTKARFSLLLTLCKKAIYVEMQYHSHIICVSLPLYCGSASCVQDSGKQIQDLRLSHAAPPSHDVQVVLRTVFYNFH